MRSTGSRTQVLRRVCALTLLLGVLSGCGTHEFLRIREDSCGGGLEAAWVWFDPPPDCPPVVLVNMIHFGSHEYYDEVQRELDRAAVVFVEGIRGGSRPDESRETRPGDDPLARLDRATAELAFELRLTTQRESLVTRQSYLSADWTEEELLRRVPMDRYLHGVSSLRETVQLIVDQEAGVLRCRYPELSFEDLAGFVRRGPLRREIANRLAQAPVEDPEIILGRNEALLRRLLLMGRTGIVAICYGADHGPHLARSLEVLGYHKQCETWHRVFSFDREPHPDMIPRP